MPPKKTKPNEKCPCGSGKKHKKCCMVAAMVAASSAPPPPTATTVLDEVMAALTLNITATNNSAAAAVAAAASESSGPSCCHGSTSDHFPDGRAYSNVIKGILAVQKDDKEKIFQFQVDNKEYLKDLYFVQYIFALCTSWYLKTKTTNDDMKVLLSSATVYKHSSDPDKVRRYGRAITQGDDRGVINCLSRETKSFCGCMQAKKMETKSMAKTDLCNGCGILFPRKDMLICGGCKIAVYCNEDCQTKDWPKHKEYCG